MKSLAENRPENNSIEGQAIFAQYRPRLQAIAYRMLGTIEEAEDMVQEAFIKWQKVSLPEIQSPQAYLNTIITRLCLDYLRSARVRREQYIGTWLPEPIVSHKLDEPTEIMELADSLAMAFLVMLERLSPIERAVFLLREVFEYEYEEISSIVAKNVPNCRQLVRRAKQHLKSERSRFPVSLDRQEQLTHKFIAACARGNLTELIDLLAADITLFSDGGGKVKALLKPIKGENKVARFLIALGRSKLIPRSDWELVRANGQIGILYSLDGVVQSIATFEFTSDRAATGSAESSLVPRDRIKAIYFVRNPDKLKRVFSSEIDNYL